MRIENGKLVYEEKNCLRCYGKRVVEDWVYCPNHGKAMRGKPCTYCGSTTKHDHRMVENGHCTCPSCKGTGLVMEDRYSSIPDDIWKSLSFTVVVGNRGLNFNESYLGMGLVYSSADYGQHWNLTDEQLIEKVREHDYVQACKIATEDDRVCPMYIIRYNNGYTVKGVDDAV